MHFTKHFHSPTTSSKSRQSTFFGSPLIPTKVGIIITHPQPAPDLFVGSPVPFGTKRPFGAGAGQQQHQTLHNTQNAFMSHRQRRRDIGAVLKGSTTNM